MRNHRHSLLTAVLLTLAACAAPLASADAPSETTKTTTLRTDELPPRFHVAESVRPRFMDLLTYSPTFRAQCQRIVDAEVRVVIEVGAPWEFDRRINAISSVVRDEAGYVRFVRVRLSHEGKWSVLIPHELEHVLEQLEGLNLAVVASRRDGAAWRVGNRAYETRRAHAAGHVVDREYLARTPTATVAGR